ncbi:unnamed protein product, partial [Musa hybrid cultivar]
PASALFEDDGVVFEPSSSVCPFALSTFDDLFLLLSILASVALVSIFHRRSMRVDRG